MIEANETLTNRKFQPRFTFILTLSNSLALLYLLSSTLQLTHLSVTERSLNRISEHT